MGKTEIALAAMIAVGLTLVGLSFLSWTSKPQLQSTPQNYQQFVGAQLQDKCATPPGYTDQQWREHMGHHPDQYKECIK